jgi:hypothetical protein
LTWWDVGNVVLALVLVPTRETESDRNNEIPAIMRLYQKGCNLTFSATKATGTNNRALRRAENWHHPKPGKTDARLSSVFHTTEKAVHFE